LHLLIYQADFDDRQQMTHTKELFDSQFPAVQLVLGHKG
jgi:hypothetical protein